MRLRFYAEARELWSKYKSKGLQFLGVPMNEFANTAPQNARCERAKMYEGVQDSSFPVMDKLTCGAPFLKFLTSQEPAKGGPCGPLETSYEKFLVDSNGVVIKRYSGFDDWVDDISPEIDSLL